MSIAKLFGFESDKHVEARLAAVQPDQVSGKLRRSLAALKKKEGGFTLLELLVVVAILAAVAGTATIILRDTDRQASAAAHVAMMDELSKGILTYRVLNNGQYPDNFDSLFAGDNDLTAMTTVDASVSGVVNTDLVESLTVAALDQAAAERLAEYGITQLRVIDPSLTHGAFNCAGTYAQASAQPPALPADGIRALINSRSNDVVNSNIFRPEGANGCGYDASAPIVDGANVLTWDTADTANAQRIKVPDNTVVYAFGVGPDSTLFDPQTRGALNNVPTYRHVTQDEYNRFIALFGVNDTTDEIELIAIIDGAGDTKDEELGEWDGTRSTL